MAITADEYLKKVKSGNTQTSAPKATAKGTFKTAEDYLSYASQNKKTPATEPTYNDYRKYYANSVQSAQSRLSDLQSQLTAKREERKKAPLINFSGKARQGTSYLTKKDADDDIKALMDEISKATGELDAIKKEQAKYIGTSGGTKSVDDWLKMAQANGNAEDLEYAKYWKQQDSMQTAYDAYEKELQRYLASGKTADDFYADAQKDISEANAGLKGVRRQPGYALYDTGYESLDYEQKYKALTNAKIKAQVGQDNRFNAEAAEADKQYSAKVADGEQQYLRYAEQNKQNAASKYSAMTGTSEEQARELLDSRGALPWYSKTEQYKQDNSWREPTEYWTEDQRDYYYYLFATDKEKANAYGELVNNQINSELKAEKQKDIQYNANKGVLPAIGSSVASVGADLVSGVDYLDKLSEYKARGTITEKDNLNLTDYSSAVKSSISSVLNEKGTIDDDVFVLGGKGLGDLYQVAMSVAQSYATIAVGGGIGKTAGLSGEALNAFTGAYTNLSFFGSAASAGIDEALKRGLAPKQAITLGTLNGLAEALGETLSVENLLHINASPAAKDLIKDVLVQAGVEGSEEGFTTILNTVFDRIVSGNESEYQQTIMDNINMGMSYDEAVRKATKDWINDISYDIVSGALSGGISAGLKTGAYAVKGAVKTADANEVSDSIELARATGENTASGKYAQSIADKQKAGSKVSQHKKDMLDYYLEQDTANADRATISNAVKERLTGKTKGNVDMLSNAIAKRMLGEELTRAERKAINSDTEAKNASYELMQAMVFGNSSKEFAWAKNLRTLAVGTNSVMADIRSNTMRTVKDEKTGERNKAMPVLDNGELKMEITKADGTKEVKSLDESNLSNYQRGVLNSIASALGKEEAPKAYAAFQYGQNVADFAHAYATIEHLAANSTKTADELYEMSKQTIAYNALTETQIKQAIYNGKQMQSEKAEKLKAETGKKTYTGKAISGNVTINLPTDVKLDETQQRALNLVNELAKTGIDFDVFYDTKTNRQGAYKKGGKIYINLASNVKGATIFANVLSHEFTHFIQNYSPKLYEDLKQFVIDEVLQYSPEQLERIVASKIARDNSITYEEAIDEIIADASERMLGNSTIAEKIAKQNPDLARAVCKAIDRINRLIRKVYDAIGIQHDEARILAEKEDVYAKYQQMWNAALEDAISNRQSDLAAGETKNTTEDGGTEQFSIKNTQNVSFNEQVDRYLGKSNKKWNRIDSFFVQKAGNRYDFLGLSNKPYFLNKTNMDKALRESGNNENYSAHAIKESIARHLPAYVKYPVIAIVEKERVSFIADETVKTKKEENAPLLIGIDPNSEVDGMPANEIKSFYGKDDFRGWIRLRAKDSKIFAINANKAEALLRDAGLQLSGPVAYASDLTDEILTLVNEEINTSSEQKYNKYSAIMTTDRIDYLIEDSGAGMKKDYAQKWISSINPTDFINLTTNESQSRDVFDKLPGDYGTNVDEYDYIEGLKNNTRQTPYLAVDENGKVVGHEGRHRMRALERNGVTNAEIVIEFRYNNGAIIKNVNAHNGRLETMPTATFENQFGTGQVVQLSNLIPLNLDHREEIIASYGEDHADGNDILYSTEDSEDNELVKEYTNSSGEIVATGNNNLMQFSTSTYKDGGRKALESYLKKNVTAEERKQMMDQMDALYDICMKFKDKYGTFAAWSDAKVVTDPVSGKPVFSVVKANGDYAMNLDFSLVCKKRRTLDAVFNEMIAQGLMDELESLPEESIASINDIIRESGFETACALCFVDSKRYRQALVADAFVEMYNKQVYSMANGHHVDKFNFAGNSKIVNTGKGIDTMRNADLDFTYIDQVLKTAGEKTVEYAIAKNLKNHPQDRKAVVRGDFMSTNGFDAIHVNNGRILKLYNKKKGAGGPKAAQSDVQYLNEVLNGRKFNVEKAYSVGGVRVQSFSDYVPRLIFDYLQMIADLSAKKLPSHAYTKELLFAMQFGLTGMKINMSLVPEIIEDGIAPGLDKDGNYAWKDGQSFGSTVYGGNPKLIKKCYELIGKKYTGQDRLTAQEGYELAMKLQQADGYTKNCGTIAVGVSDEHIRKMLRDSNIRMVIPYHKSSLNHIVAMMTNIGKYTDYTNSQNTRKDGTLGASGHYEGGRKPDPKTTDKGFTDFNFNEEMRRLQRSKDPAVAGNAAKLAADAYLEWCDKNKYTPKFEQFANEENYYKLLEDFTCYDEAGTFSEQGAVTLTLPKETDAFGDIKSLIELGLEEDVLLQEKQDKAVPQIVDRIRDEIATRTQEAQEKYGNGTHYSTADDEEYLRAIESSDMDTADDIVAKIAKAKGYDSPKLYHGTTNFGFDTIDFTKSDDGYSFWTTSDLDTARTYTHTGGDTIKSVTNKPVDPDSISGVELEELHNELYADNGRAVFYLDEKEVKDKKREIIEYFTKLGSIISDMLNDERFSSDTFRNIVPLLAFDINEITQTGFLDRESRDYIIRELSEVSLLSGTNFSNYLTSKSILEDDVINALYDACIMSSSDEIFQLYTKGENHHGTVVSGDEVRLLINMNTNLWKKQSGIYQLYGKTAGLAEFDAESANWDEIDGTPIGIDGEASTRDFADYAKNNGYSGVILHNVRDNGGRNYKYEFKNIIGDVYVFFNASDVKSADTITYDSDGNIIPPSKRFNSNVNELRWSTQESETYDKPVKYSTEDMPYNARQIRKKVRSMTYFSGGGTIDFALAGLIDSQFAVEYNPKIAAIYKENNGDNIYVGNVLDVDLNSIPENIEYFHASPSCTNVSNMNRNSGEVEVDRITAQRTADTIRATIPKVFTLENVKQYDGTVSLKRITDTLDELGYTWDKRVLNSADYGSATSRERLMLIAVKTGNLPAWPKKMAKRTSWYEAVTKGTNLMDTLKEADTINPRMIESLKTVSGIDVNNIDKPLFVFGESYANKEFGHAWADEPLPTIIAKSGASRIFMPDGRVLDASPRLLARISGLPDSYSFGKAGVTLQRRIIGNGIPAELTQAVVTPLLEQIDNEVRFSKRNISADFTSKETNELAKAALEMRMMRDKLQERYKRLEDYVRNGPKPDVVKKDVEAIYNVLAQKIGFNPDSSPNEPVSKQEIIDEMHKLANEMKAIDLSNADDDTRESFLARTKEIARKMIENAYAPSEVDTLGEQEAVLEKLGTKKPVIYVPQLNLKDFGNTLADRRSNFPHLIITSDESNKKAVKMEDLIEELDTIFDRTSDFATNAEKLENILSQKPEMVNQYEDVNGADIEMMMERTSIFIASSLLSVRSKAIADTSKLSALSKAKIALEKEQRLTKAQAELIASDDELLKAVTDVYDKAIEDGNKYAGELREQVNQEYLKRRLLERELDALQESTDETIESLKNKIEIQKVDIELLKKEIPQKRREALEKYKENLQEKQGKAKHIKKIQKITNDLTTWMLKNSDKEHIPEVLKETVGDFLETIDFTSTRALNGGKPTKADTRFATRLARLTDVLRNQVSGQSGEELTDKLLDAYVDMPMETIETLSALQWRAMQAMESGQEYTVNTMSADELAKLADSLKVLRNAIITMNKTFANAKYASIVNMADDTFKYLGDRADAPDDLRSDRGLRATANDFLNWNNLVPRYAFKRYGESGAALFQSVVNGWGKMARNAQMVIDFAKETYTEEEARAWENEKIEIELSNKTKVSMAIAEAMDFYNATKRQQAVQHILGGGIKTRSGANHIAVAAEDIQRIVSVLTDRQVEVASKLQQFAEKYGSEWGNEVSFRRYGYNFFGEKNYWPITTDPTDRPAADHDVQQSMYRLLNMSATKSLNPKANNAEVLGSVFDVFANHMSDMAKYNGLALPMLDMIKWFNYKTKIPLTEPGQFQSKTIQRELERVFGTGATQYFKNFMKDLNGTKEGGRGEGTLKAIISNYKVAQIGFNLRVVAQQPTSMARAALLINPKFLLSSKFSKAARDEMMEHSGLAVWKIGLGFYDVNINASMRDQIKHSGTKLSRLQQKYTDASTYLAGKGDELAWTIMWQACKKEQTVKGLTGDELMKATTERFEDLMLATQVIDSTISRSEMMRNTSVAMSEYTGFMSEPTMSYNMLADAYDSFRVDQKKSNWAEAWRKNQGKLTKTLLVWQATAAITALAAAVIDAGRDDDEYMSWLQKFLTNAWSNYKENVNPFSLLPIVSDVFELIKSKLTGSYSASESMVVSGISKLIDFVKLSGQMITGNYKGNTTAWGVVYKGMQSIGMTTGIPVAPIAREATGMWNSVATIYNDMFGNRLDHKAPMIHTYNEPEKTKINNAFKSGNLKPEEAIAQLGTNSKSLIKELYQGTGDSGKQEISKEEAVSYLKQYCKLTSKEAEKTVKEWSLYADKGIQYSNMQESYNDGKMSEKDAVSWLITYGGKSEAEAQKTVTKWNCYKDTGIRYDDIKDSLLIGEITESQASEYWQKYGGLDAEKAEDKAKSAVFNEENGVDWSYNSNLFQYYNNAWADGYDRPMPSAKDAGFTPQQWEQYYTGVTKVEGTDNNNDGKTDAYSKRRAVIAYIADLPITTDQKWELFYTQYHSAGAVAAARKAF